MICWGFLSLSALAIDTLLGDPRSKWHPVVLIGRLISFLESVLLAGQQTVKRKKLAGILLVFLVVGLVYAAIYLLLAVAALGGTIVLWVFSILLLSFTISPRALKEAAGEIKKLLVQGELVQAREKVGWIVGRDTQNLEEAEITRATVETVAENITDGIISPLFFALLGGVPLAFAYRAVNTLDSMVGYKNDKYLDFGWAAARFDDICNFIPARITGLLVVVCAFLGPGYNGSRAWQMLWRDAKKHPSPNSGYAEAPVAGALGVRLGGCNYYFGRPSFREYMGEPVEILHAGHIRKTVFLMYGVTISFIFLTTLLLQVIFAQVCL